MARPPVRGSLLLIHALDVHPAFQNALPALQGLHASVERLRAQLRPTRPAEQRRQVTQAGSINKGDIK